MTMIIIARASTLAETKDAGLSVLWLLGAI
jgi:hypothetical protein